MFLSALQITFHLIQQKQFSCGQALVLTLQKPTFSYKLRNFSTRGLAFSSFAQLHLYSATVHRITKLSFFCLEFLIYLDQFKTPNTITTCLSELQITFHFISQKHLSCRQALVLTLHKPTFTYRDRRFSAYVGFHYFHLLSCTYIVLMYKEAFKNPNTLKSVFLHSKKRFFSHFRNIFHVGKHQS